MFELATAGRIVFGPGAIASLPERVATMPAPAGSAAVGSGVVLLFSGRDSRHSRPIGAALEARGFSVVTLAVEGEPSVERVRGWVGVARATHAAVVVSIGGGSTIDAGKATAILAAHPGDPLDYLEVVGLGRALDHPGLPFVAVPTTAGTGAEVTRNAVLTVDGSGSSSGIKASLRSAFMLPALAVVDPDLLGSLPAQVIAHSGLDALSQLVEPWLSVRANPVSDALARDGIRRSARALGEAFRQVPRQGLREPLREPLKNRPDLREELALASLFGGLCLANAGLGAVHGFAAPAGGMIGAPHGAICAALLPHVLAVNLRALRERPPSPGRDATLARFDELATLVTGAPAGSLTADEGVAWIASLCRQLDAPGLGRLGLGPDRIPELVAKARDASSMKGNPLPLTDAELTEIATLAL
jgi:alcohol dehydrogenase class IV